MSPRVPGRHDAPLEPLEMSEADVLGFGEQIMSGFKGQAPWRRPCTCDHFKAEHFQAIGRCGRCPCRLFAEAQHERMVIWLHPDAHNYLPPGIYVVAVGQRYEPVGTNERGQTVHGVQFLLGRDLDSDGIMVVRSGVKRETTIYTSPPEGEEA